MSDWTWNENYLATYLASYAKIARTAITTWIIKLLLSLGE